MTDMEQLQAILKVELDTDDREVLTAQLSYRAAWQSRISLMHREAKSELARARGQMFNPSLTSEDKRRIDLELRTREQQKQADLLGDLQSILAQHITLGESILASL